MEALDNICLITGVVSVGVGIYVFVTKKLVGRDTGKIPQDKIRKFLPYETATYILLGILLAEMPERQGKRGMVYRFRNLWYNGTVKE